VSISEIWKLSRGRKVVVSFSRVTLFPYSLKRLMPSWLDQVHLVIILLYHTSLVQLPSMSNIQLSLSAIHNTWGLHSPADHSYHDYNIKLKTPNIKTSVHLDYSHPHTSTQIFPPHTSNTVPKRTYLYESIQHLQPITFHCSSLFQSSAQVAARPTSAHFSGRTSSHLHPLHTSEKPSPRNNGRPSHPSTTKARLRTSSHGDSL
jgi:hypothetical protein